VFLNFSPQSFAADITTKRELYTKELTPVHWAVKNNKLKILNYIAQTALSELKKTLNIQDEHGYTPIHWAAKNGDIETLKLFAKEAEEELIQALKIKDGKGNTPFHWAAMNNHGITLKFFNQLSPGTGLLMQNDFRETLIHYAARFGHTTLLRLIEEISPEEFTTSLSIKGRQEKTLIHWAAENNFVEMKEFTDRLGLDEIKELLTTQDIFGDTPLHWIAKNGDIATLRLLTRMAPDQLKSSLKIKNRSGETPVSNAINNLEALKIMAKYAQEFSDALTMQDNYRYTPVHYAVKTGNLKILRLLFAVSQESFLSTLSMHGDTDAPIFATSQKETLEFLSEVNPKALLLRGRHSFSFLHYLRIINPNEFKSIEEKTLVLLKNNPNLLKQLNKEWNVDAEIERIKKSGHIFNFDGSLPLIEIITDKKYSDTRLEGYSPEPLFNCMGINFNFFKKSYPDLMAENEFSLIQQLIDLGANQPSIESQYQGWKEGLPILLNTGFLGHYVSILIWGDQLIICNRGDASRRPMDCFHFNPNKLDLNILNKIKSSNEKKSKDYKKLYFDELPKNLDFLKNDFDLTIEKTYPFAPQSVGNCSYVSPITSICAAMIIMRARGMDENKKLNKEKSLSSLTRNEIQKKQIHLQGRIDKAIHVFQLWLSNEQITDLESQVDSLKGSNFVPQYKLIKESMRKSCLLPLDDHCQKRLDAVINKYLDLLNIREEEAEIKTDIAYWKTLPRIAMW
jgi:ankyrin repeat protein